MMRRLSGRIVIASHNRGKLTEIAELLAPYGIEAVSAVDLDLPEPEEIGATYDEEGLLRLLRLARIGCGEIFAAQDRATAR